MTSRLTRPMIDTLVPVRAPALRVALQLTLGVLAMALLAQIEITIGPVPITGQTLGVLLIGAAYGFNLGALTLLSYLLVGSLGLGVFTQGGAGLSHFTGTTAGYLIAFPVAAAVVGLLSQLRVTHGFLGTALTMLVGNALIYIPGLFWLHTFAGQYAKGQDAWQWTLNAGLYPFIPGDIFKLLLATALLPMVWRLLGERKS